MIKWTYNEIARFEALTAILRNSFLTGCWYASFIWEASERLSIKFCVALCIKFWFASVYIADLELIPMFQGVYSLSTLENRNCRYEFNSVYIYIYMYASDSSVLVLTIQMGQLPFQEVL